MIPAEPQLQKAPRANHYKGRWRWWYAAICDYRLTHPGCTNVEVGLHLKKNPNTIASIVSTDMYREYEAQRRQHWRESAENDLRQKLTNVTSKALDAMEIQLDKKRDQIPLSLAREVVATGLEALGFGPSQAPSVVVNNNQQVLVPNAVSPAALEEARMALREAEARRAIGNLGVLELEAEPSSEKTVVVEGVSLGTASDS